MTSKERGRDEMSDLYRCGWCGGPTDKHGNRISIDEAEAIAGDFDNATLTHGTCCADLEAQAFLRYEREAMERAAYHDAMMEDVHGKRYGS